MKNNLVNTLNFYKDQVTLFTELGDNHRANLYKETVKEIEAYLKNN